MSTSIFSHSSLITAFPDLNQKIMLPPDLDGSCGTNRAIDKPVQIAAQTDLAAIQAWLARYTDTPNTLASYRKEAERLLLWAILNRSKPLSSLTHEDLLDYQHFLSNPQPAERWVMSTHRKVGRQDPRWRPFTGPLAATSRRQALIILNTLFSWLVAAGYLAGNPLALSRQRARKARSYNTRYLDAELWRETKVTILSLPRKTQRDHEHYHRVRWLFTLLYLCGLRISEICENSMGNFFQRAGADAQEYWWLEIIGKGDKPRLVPATSELMMELSRYRQSHALSALPFPGENIPLLLPIGGRRQPLTRSALHVIIKTVFVKTAERLRTTHPARAHLLERASAHWLRHTAGSRMADSQLDPRFVRDNFGHANLSTTNTYLHSDDDARHQETERRHILHWD